ncbi:MAG: RimK/LysX family protein [Pseudomonadales bacterium]|nr:RimK/LysX family protein [Pseudomonadales bacterium]
MILNLWTAPGWAESDLAAKKERSAKTEKLNEKRIMGWVENVYIGNRQTKLKAKLDTGAKTSSIQANDIEHFIRDQQPWVRFVIKRDGKKAYIDKKGRSHPEKKAIEITLERPLLRTAKIKQHHKKSVERPVVTLDMILGGKHYPVEFTLTDRRKFIYPVLLGRRFLRNVAIVDPSSTFLTSNTQSDNGHHKDAEIPSQQAPKPVKLRP